MSSLNNFTININISNCINFRARAHIHFCFMQNIYLSDIREKVFKRCFLDVDQDCIAYFWKTKMIGEAGFSRNFFSLRLKIFALVRRG